MYKWDLGQNFFKPNAIGNVKNFHIPSESLGAANAKNIDIAKGANWWNKSTGLTAAQGWNLTGSILTAAGKIASKEKKGQPAPAQNLSWVAAVDDELQGYVG